MKVNDTVIDDYMNYELNEGDNIKIFSVRKYEDNADSKITFTSNSSDVNI